MFDLIKVDLPNFPDEVISDWLEPFAQSDGWPPTAPRWRGILAHSLEEWRSHSWRQVDLNLATSSYAPITHQQIDGLRDAYLFKVPGIFQSMLGDDGEKRYLRVLMYLLTHGTFPKPIVFRNSPDGLELMDGNHRFLAWGIMRRLERDMLSADEEELRTFKEKLRESWGVQKIVPLSLIQRVWIAYPS